MDYQTIMESFAEWMAVANTNGNLFLTPNGVQSQALSLTTSSGNSHQNNASENGTNSGKTLAVRCVVESVPNVQYWNLPHGNGQVEVDRRANIPVDTTCHNLVEVVLQMFGYPKETAITARGLLLVDNWKPLRLEKVPMSPQKSVSDIMKQFSSNPTLRIQILRTTSCANIVFSQMKDKLLQLLVLQNIELITSSGCPLDQITLKNILSPKDYGASTPSDEVLQKFDLWVRNQMNQTLRPTIPYPSSLSQFTYHLRSPNALHFEKDHISSGIEDRMQALQSAQNQFPTQKTRMRTSFDPEFELPRLQKWFSENQHPDRQQIKLFVDELNSLDSRRGRKPLDMNNVVYWFKNARAAQKRIESRTPSGHNLMNGYHSNSHSPCDTALTSKGSLGSARSIDGDYGEDDDNRSEMNEHDEHERDDSLDARPSCSPVAPLSLTKHKDNNNCSRNSSPVAEVKREPSDKIDRESSPSSQRTATKESPRTEHADSGGGGESESEDEDIDEDVLSEPESLHKSISSSARETAVRNTSAFAVNSSPLSLIPRSVNNSLFPAVPNYNFPMFNMSQYTLGLNMSRGGSALQAHQNSNNHHSSSAFSAEDRRGKRNRTFIDPVTEVPCLESWFLLNTHPSHNLISQYTKDLNSMPYRQKFPPLETKNVQFWFKNRRAKNKRLRTSMYEIGTNNNNLSPEQLHQFAAALTNENFKHQD